MIFHRYTRRATPTETIKKIAPEDRAIAVILISDPYRVDRDGIRAFLKKLRRARVKFQYFASATALLRAIARGEIRCVVGIRTTTDWRRTEKNLRYEVRTAPPDVIRRRLHIPHCEDLTTNECYTASFGIEGELRVSPPPAPVEISSACPTCPQ